MTEELESMSADGRTTKEIHSRQRKTSARQEVCVVDAKNHRCPENFRDAVTGQSLDSTLVREARRKEVQYFESKWVWHKRPRSEAYNFTGKLPISVKWVDVNKGDDEFPNYRSRLVANRNPTSWRGYYICTNAPSRVAPHGAQHGCDGSFRRHQACATSRQRG